MQMPSYFRYIVALRNEKGSYNIVMLLLNVVLIVALRNEKGSYNQTDKLSVIAVIVALRNEKGSYNGNGATQFL